MDMDGAIRVNQAKMSPAVTELKQTNCYLSPAVTKLPTYIPDPFSDIPMGFLDPISDISIRFLWLF